MIFKSVLMTSSTLLLFQYVKSHENWSNGKHALVLVIELFLYYTGRIHIGFTLFGTKLTTNERFPIECRKLFRVCFGFVSLRYVIG